MNNEPELSQPLDGVNHLWSRAKALLHQTQHAQHLFVGQWVAVSRLESSRGHFAHKETRKLLGIDEALLKLKEGTIGSGAHDDTSQAAPFQCDVLLKRSNRTDGRVHDNATKIENNGAAPLHGRHCTQSLLQHQAIVRREW